ncbi:putative ankyrin repeat protein like [Verticillium longisporum]|nr:putative ankyrin repeat protein like [Verticillium longisporum]
MCDWAWSDCTRPLAKGADVNAQGGEYGNALQAASSEGHTNIVQLLRAKGADVNARGGQYDNVLQAASSGGHVEIVQLLLAKGADANARSVKYGNAQTISNLRIASSSLSSRSWKRATGMQFYRFRSFHFQLTRKDLRRVLDCTAGEFALALTATLRRRSND